VGHGVGRTEGRRSAALPGRNYPECLENLRVLDEHAMAACEAAMRGDRCAYLLSLRCYMRAGRDEALRIRRGAA
jgi:hypothetical protein